MRATKCLSRALVRSGGALLLRQGNKGGKSVLIKATYLKRLGRRVLQLSFISLNTNWRKKKRDGQKRTTSLKEERRNRKGGAGHSTVDQSEKARPEVLLEKKKLLVKAGESEKGGGCQRLKRQLGLKKISRRTDGGSGIRMSRADAAQIRQKKEKGRKPNLIVAQ